MPPLISCLCLTHKRVPLLRRAVQCFRNQTHAERELLLVFEAEDAATRDYVASLSGEPGIRSIQAAAGLSLGALRNLALAEARGPYVAQWDDDDWHGPTRLAEQLAALEASGRSGCVLLRLVLHDAVTGQSHLSGPRPWEGSLLARREALPAYADLGQGEDTPVVVQLFEAGQLVALEHPLLYIYVQHGANTWSRQHWAEVLLPAAEPLTPEEAAEVQRLLAR